MGRVTRHAWSVHGRDLSRDPNLDRAARDKLSGRAEGGVRHPGDENTVEYILAEISLIVPLAIGYYAIRAVAAPLVGAEERGELDTILALPLSRRVLVAGSCVVAAITSAAILALIGVMTFLAGTQGPLPRHTSRSGWLPAGPRAFGRSRCLPAAWQPSLQGRCIAP